MKREPKKTKIDDMYTNNCNDICKINETMVVCCILYTEPTKLKAQFTDGTVEAYENR